MSKTTSAEPDLAALEKEAARRFAVWVAKKRAITEHETQVASDRAFLSALPAATKAAAADPRQLAALREERRTVEDRLAQAAEIAQGLSELARDAGSEYVTAWHAAAASIRAELLGGFAEKRARLDAQEAEARAACEARIARLPS